MHVRTRLIDTTFSVHDSAGKPLLNLPETSFSITEDGVSQTIRYFAQERDLPLRIGLLVDESGSQGKFVKEHESAIAAFLAEVLDPRDEAFAICFGNHLRLVSDATSNSSQLLDGIRRFDKGDREFAELGPKEERDLGTALDDAVYFAIRQRMEAVQGQRKVLLVFSDGEENSSEHDLLDAIAEAQSSNVLVYAVRTTALKHGRMNARDRYGMRLLNHLTEQTGGRAFDATLTDVSADFATIAAELRSLYEIGYYSNNQEQAGGFHKVVITLHLSGAAVQSRSGYSAK